MATAVCTFHCTVPSPPTRCHGLHLPLYCTFSFDLVSRSASYILIHTCLLRPACRGLHLPLYGTFSFDPVSWSASSTVLYLLLRPGVTVCIFHCTVPSPSTRCHGLHLPLYCTFSFDPVSWSASSAVLYILLRPGVTVCILHTDTYLSSSTWCHSLHLPLYCTFCSGLVSQLPHSAVLYHCTSWVLSALKLSIFPLRILVQSDVCTGDTVCTLCCTQCTLFKVIIILSDMCVHCCPRKTLPAALNKTFFKKCSAISQVKHNIVSGHDQSTGFRFLRVEVRTI